MIVWDISVKMVLSALTAWMNTAASVNEDMSADIATIVRHDTISFKNKSLFLLSVYFHIQNQTEGQLYV